MAHIRVPLPFGVATFDPATLITTGTQHMPREIHITVAPDNAPQISLVVTTTSQRGPHCTSIAVTATAQAPHVGARHLREVKVREWTSAAVTAVAAMVVDEPATRRNPGRRDHDLLRRVADIYNSASAEAPALAVRQTYPNAQKRTVARWIANAKAEGYIPEKGSGNNGEE